MKKLLDKVLKIGIEEGQAPYISTKIKASNAIGLIVVFFIAIPYIVISYFMYRPLMFLPLLGIIGVFIGFVFNYIRLTTIGRLIIAFSPVLLSETFIGYLVPEGKSVSTQFNMHVISMGLASVPFLVIDLRERYLISFSCILILVIFIFGTPWFIDTFNNTEMEQFNFNATKIGYFNLLLGFSFLIASILSLSYQNLRVNKRSLELIEEMEVKSKDMTTSENQLKEKIVEIEKAQEEEKKRAWATAGMAEVSTIMRSEQDSSKLYDKIMSYLTKYMDSNQSALFLVDDHDSDTTLSMVASYAYSRKKFISKTIAVGQGLVGQVYLEKESMYLRDVPDDYVNITSGMGEATPREVIIVPLIVNEQVEGIIEMASFGSYEKHQIQFLEQLGETLASFININKINQKTKVLLEESQQQTEEMRAQEEEMRQNMEELAATQEEMHRKEQEYITKIDELKVQINASK